MSNTCIDISVKRVGEPLSFALERIGNETSFSVARDGEALDFKASRINNPITISVERKGKPLDFRCGLVCTVGDAAYLRVAPDSIWLLPENDFSAEVVVYSNVTWKVE